MRITLELDDVKYGATIERGAWDDENFAMEIGELVEKTVMHHLGHVAGMPRIEE